MEIIGERMEVIASDAENRRCDKCDVSDTNHRSAVVMVLATSSPPVCNGNSIGQLNKCNTVGRLRDLVRAEKDLTCSTSDKFLTKFLKASRNDIKQSHTLVKEYFQAKIDNPEIFVTQSPAKYVNYLRRYDIGFPLNGLDNNGRRILYIRLGNVDPLKESFVDIFQTMVMIIEAFSLEEDVQETGLTMMLDVTEFTLKLMKWATPTKLRILMRILQDCVPVRFEVIHVVNAPLVFNVFYAAVKPFMNEEFKRKLHWHSGDCKSLFKHMPRHVLPTNLGGDIEIEDIKDWYKMVLDKESYFEELRKMGYNKF